jgi:hypothetical protein
MIPYAIGIIAGIYYPNTNFGTTSKKFARASEPKHAAISSEFPRCLPRRNCFRALFAQPPGGQPARMS